MCVICYETYDFNTKQLKLCKDVNKNLKELFYTTKNNIYDTTINIFLVNFSNLEELDCSSTQFFDDSTMRFLKIPKELVKLTSLKCYKTLINEIPKELINLTKLNCFSTQVDTIPKELVNLTQLICSRTNIKEIPKELVNLTELTCANTQVKEIPIELVNLKFINCDDHCITHKVKKNNYINSIRV